MTTPKDELPDVEQIRQLAQATIPPHIILRDVRCTYGSEFPSVIPEDYDITIEYEETPDAPPAGTNAAIEAFQAWSHPLIQDIRSQWPPESVRITFTSRHNC
jgi:hypothetical protein